MTFYTRRFLGRFLTRSAEPVPQMRRNSGVVCQDQVRSRSKESCTSCTRLRGNILHFQSSVIAHSLAKRRYHKQLFQHLSDYDSKDEGAILHYLKRNIVHLQDGIAAFNKPAGLGVSGRQDEEDDSKPLTLSRMMSQIAELVDFPSAEIAIGLDKEASGLVLLAENRRVARELQTKVRDARNKRQFIRSYKAIVCGLPEEKEGVSKVYLGTDVIQGVNMTVRRDNPSGRQIRDGDVWSSETKYRVISKNRELGCALLELQPLRVRRHQLQVQLTNELCPVLGDHIYSHQVKTILGKPVLMDPQKVLAVHNMQVLSPGIRKALSLTNQQVSLLPLFLHLHRMILPEWAGNQDVTMVAPLPSHFMKALKQLGLDSGSEDVKQLTAR